MTTNALETFPIVNQLDGRFAQAAPSRKPIATELWFENAMLKVSRVLAIRV
jgi:hypothetical protein